MATQSLRIPGIDDLLICPIAPSDPRKMAHAAANARAAINPGIAAIGELLWQASETDGGVSQDTAFNIGVLLKTLSELNEALVCREVSGYQLMLNSQLAKAAAGGEG